MPCPWIEDVVFGELWENEDPMFFWTLVGIKFGPSRVVFFQARPPHKSPPGLLPLAPWLIKTEYICARFSRAPARFFFSFRKPSTRAKKP